MVENVLQVETAADRAYANITDFLYGRASITGYKKNLLLDNENSINRFLEGLNNAEVAEVFNKVFADTKISINMKTYVAIDHIHLLPCLEFLAYNDVRENVIIEIFCSPLRDQFIHLLHCLIKNPRIDEWMLGTAIQTTYATLSYKQEESRWTKNEVNPSLEEEMNIFFSHIPEKYFTRNLCGAILDVIGTSVSSFQLFLKHFKKVNDIENVPDEWVLRSLDLHENANYLIFKWEEREQ